MLKTTRIHHIVSKICGYDKNVAALEFHHKDSTQKEFKLDARKLANTK